MSESLVLPFFTEDGNCFSYLEQYPYIDLGELEAGSPIRERILLSEGIHIIKPKIEVPYSAVSDKLVVLEPHPDDMALSASGYVMRALARGGQCQVIDLFSRTSINRFPWRDKVHLDEEALEQLRLQESHLAVEEFLGQQFSTMQLPLASKRGYKDIFSRSHDDDELVASIGKALVKSIADSGANKILSPLAVQGHIDHLVTFDVGMYIKRVLGNEVDLILYEDYPYSRNKTAYTERLGEVRADSELDPEYVEVDDYLDAMADMAIIYRSQFDDLNRDQMHAIMREDFRATALERQSSLSSAQSECAQRYWLVYEN